MCPPAIKPPQVVDSEDFLRNVLCPYYNTCLDNAVKKILSGWDCSACMHKNTKEEIDHSESLRCGRLLNKIFYDARHEKDLVDVKKMQYNSLPGISAQKWLRIITNENL